MSTIQTAGLIICEQKDRWARAFRRLEETDVAIIGRQSLDACDLALAAWPGSLVAVEVRGTGLAEVLSWIARLECRFPDARAIALLGRGLDGVDGALREAGAIHVVTSPRGMNSVGGLVRRHFSLAPRSEPDLADRIFASLPWGDR